MHLSTILTAGRKAITGCALALGLLTASASIPVAHAAEPLRIGYSDWPGWVAWQVAIEKGWLKEAGVDAKFEWFDYSASMDAFSAGKLDAVTCTNGDALVMGGNGAKNVMIMLTDYSNGNDMIVGKPGVKALADLKGKKVGLEVGLVEHLLLINGLTKLGLKEADVTLVNAKTNETPQVLASGDVSAIGAWQPVAGQAMKGAAGAKPLYTSAERAGPDLRRGHRLARQPVGPSGRVDQVRRRLEQGRRLYSGSEDAGRCGGDHGGQGRHRRAHLHPLPQGHQAPHPG